jgi:hypothetical protein
MHAATGVTPVVYFSIRERFARTSASSRKRTFANGRYRPNADGRGRANKSAATEANEDPMKHVPNLLVALVSLVAGSASALEPCRSKDVYVEAVDKIIDGAIGRPAELALTVFPSFEAEYGMRMVGRDVYLVTLRPSVWESSIVIDGASSYHHDFRKAHANPSVQKASISTNLAAQVQQKYNNAISAISRSEADALDGTTYRFVVQGGGCGETWSPEQKSANGQLVELAELLAAHARQSKQSFLVRSEEKIFRALDPSK